MMQIVEMQLMPRVDACLTVRAASPQKATIAFIFTEETMRTRMNIATKGGSQVLAGDNRQASEYENGYAHGERLRTLNELPPKYLMFEIDNYAFGFRAGYTARVRMTPCCKGGDE